MGCFDSVNFRCPKCEANVEVQSKAGDCSMSEFDQYRVPVAIAVDIDGDSAWCSACDESFEVISMCQVKEVPMMLGTRRRDG